MAKNKRKAIWDFVQPRVRFLLVSLLFFIVLSAMAGYAFAYQHKVLPQVSISGQNVAGLNKEELESAVAKRGEDFIAKPIKVKYSEEEWSVIPKDFGLSIDTSSAIEQAYDFGHRGDIWQQIKDMFLALISPQSYDVSILPFSDSGKDYLQKTVLQGIEKPYEETSIKVEKGKAILVTGKSGKQLDRNIFELDLYRLYKYGDSELTLQLKQTEPIITIDQAEPVRARLESLINQPWVVKAGQKSEQYNVSEVSSWFKVVPEKNDQDVAVGLLIDVNDSAVESSLNTLIKDVNVNAQNAQVRWDKEQSKIMIDKPEVKGLACDVPETIKTLHDEVLGKTELDHTMIVVTREIIPDVRADNYEEMGIKEVIGTAYTDFSGSPNNRKFNIDKGRQSLNGGVIKDGATYSTTDSLGPVDESTGYLPELVIINNRTVPEAGGGLCQVSTTLFRAVLNAGLPVVERSNHAYRVGYYERNVGPGLDATVYIPSPDFKWKNDTGHAILIQSYIKDNKIFFELYGTKDGRISTVSTPQILEETPPGNPMYVETDTLYKDEKKQIETAHSGAKTSVTYTVSRDGKEINRQTFKSTYRPWPAQYLVGTKERPTENTNATGAPNAGVEAN